MTKCKISGHLGRHLEFIKRPRVDSWGRLLCCRGSENHLKCSACYEFVQVRNLILLAYDKWLQNVFRPLCFFSLFQMSAGIRFRQRITKKKCVFLPSACIGLLPISVKTMFISGDKKKHPCFYSACCFVALINFLSNRSKVCFYFVALINFSRNVSNVFYLFHRPH